MKTANRGVLFRSDWRTVRLGDVADLCLGKMLDRKKNRGKPLRYLRNPNIRWFDVDVSDLREMPFEEHECERYGVREGDVLVCEGGEAGRAAIWNGRLSNVKFQKAIHRVRTGPAVYNRFLVHKLFADYHNGRLADYYTGATIKHLTGQDLARYEFSLPPMAEQRRIAEVLDRAEVLRVKRREALTQLNVLIQAIFIHLFGDPALNPKGWPRKSIGELAVKMSDGPFGSNLKSSHYTESGVRVIRLQNIGIGELLDDDRAYISEEHFQRLRKHECIPGDVLVGTLGDPNLRACIQPSWLPTALNKADCVQLRPDRQLANAEYICALLNQPSTERMAQNIMLGQTRVRISMGRLRGLEVPLPPISLQEEFRRCVAAIESLKILHLTSLTELDALFASLQHRAFNGTLWDEPVQLPAARMA